MIRRPPRSLQRPRACRPTRRNGPSVREKRSLRPDTPVRNLLVFPISYLYNRPHHEVFAGDRRLVERMDTRHGRVHSPPAEESPTCIHEDIRCSHSRRCWPVCRLVLPAFAQDVQPSHDEVLAPEAHYSPYVDQHFPNRVFWGDAHLHMSYSSDAGMIGDHGRAGRCLRVDLHAEWQQSASHGGLPRSRRAGQPSAALLPV